jgi:hypothetical protein
MGTTLPLLVNVDHRLKRFALMQQNDDRICERAAYRRSWRGTRDLNGFFFSI